MTLIGQRVEILPSVKLRRSRHRRSSPNRSPTCVLSMGTALVHNRRDGSKNRQLSTGEDVLQTWQTCLITWCPWCRDGRGVFRTLREVIHQCYFISDASCATKQRAPQVRRLDTTQVQPAVADATAQGAPQPTMTWLKSLVFLCRLVPLRVKWACSSNPCRIFSV